MSSKNVPKSLRRRYEEITVLTDAFCQARLTEEYKELCQEMTAALSRKRPSPLSTGRANSWACGIVFVIGRINFLFDDAGPLQISRGELCQNFNLSQSTGSAKASSIMNMLKTMEMDPQWTVPSRLADNPFAWFVTLEGGFVVDARQMPREFQEEAFRLGVIPFVPE